MNVSRRLRIIAISFVAIAAAVLLGLWLGLPAAARWGIETYGSREIGRQITVGGIRFNPLTLTARVQGLRIAGLPNESAPLLTIDSLLSEVSPTSLRHLAPVIDALQMKGIRANVVRVTANRFNFSDIVDRLLAKPSSPDPARFAVHNIEIDDAAIEIDDQVTQSKHMLDAIRLGIPFISRLPADGRIVVKPSFSALFDGKAIALNAESHPFDEALDTGASLKLKAIDLPKYLAYLPVKPNFDLHSGSLDADLHMTFQRATPATKTEPARPAALAVKGTVAVSNVSLAPRAGDRLIAWDRLDVALDDVDLIHSSVRVRSVALDGLKANLVRGTVGDFIGAWVLQHPFEPAPGADAAAPTAANQPFMFDVGELKVNDAQIDIRDETVGWARRVAPLRIDLAGLSNRPGTTARLAVSFATDDKAGVTIKGDVGLAPVKADLRATLSAMSLKTLQPYLKRLATARVEGTLNAGVHMLVEQTPAGLVLRAEDGQFDVAGLRVRDDGQFKAQIDMAKLVVAGIAFDLQSQIARVGSVSAKSLKLRDTAKGTAKLDLPALDIANIDVALERQTATIARIIAKGPDLRATRRADGTFDWLVIARAQTPLQTPSPSPAPAEVRATTPPLTGAPWTLGLDEVQLIDGHLQVLDQMHEPAAQLASSAIQFSLRNFSSDGRARSTVRLRARAGGGTLSANGWARLTPLASSLDVDVQNVDLVALRPYLRHYSGATLSSAALWTKGTLALEAASDARSAPRVTFGGTARLTNVAVLDRGGESLLRWQSLDVDGINANTRGAAPEISLGKIALSDFFARVVLSAEGKLNLGDVVRPGEAEPIGVADAAPAGAPKEIQKEAAAGVSPRPLIRIGGIEFVRGNVNYTDLFVKPNYTANLTQLGGTISAVASDVATPADVSVRGSIDNDAPVGISGQVNPLAAKLYLNLSASAKGVELPRLTPYSIKYAGYPITKGKLSVDLRYHIDNDQLKADNHVYLDQLTFGEKVDSPTATQLPVLLAVSLLKDRNGQIDINLPISGSLNDPQFSVGGIIVKVIVNLITKALTAPFSLLASAFGGGEELSFVAFPPGSATPADQEAKKIESLAKAMNDRPGLRLEITGRVDPAIDTEPLRNFKLDTLLRNAKVRQIVREGGAVDPATVTISDAERPDLIAAVYDDTKILDKPRNFIGIAKKIPVADMERLLLGTIAVNEPDLRKLAQDRAANVREQLQDAGRVPRERVFLLAPKLDAEGIKDKGATMRVDFSLK